MKYAIFAQKTGKVMTYDGEKFSERAPVVFGSQRAAATVGRRLIKNFRVLRTYRVWVGTIGKRIRHTKGVAAKGSPNKSARKRNPAIRDPELQQAGQLLEDFSGHEPTEVLKVHESPMRRGLVIGQLDGVLYTTVRDGKVERYIHKFRKQSRPLLTARSDGKQLGIVGGRFQMTEAGIEDR